MSEEEIIIDLTKNVEEIKPGLYVKKTKLGYNVVFPIKKDLERPFNFKDNCNWKHLITGGSWFNLIKIIGFISLILFMCWGYAHDTKECRELIEEHNFDTTYMQLPLRVDEESMEISYFRGELNNGEAKSLREDVSPYPQEIS